MTPEQINIAIAKSLPIPWTDVVAFPLSGIWGKSPCGGYEAVPDYYHSLDCIVPVVRSMPDRKQRHVLSILWKIIHPNEPALSTPAQWCEAYLRALNLWTDAPETIPA
jgi:hypothetical protein